MFTVHLKSAAYAARRHPEINAEARVIFRLTSLLDELRSHLQNLVHRVEVGDVTFSHGCLSHDIDEPTEQIPMFRGRTFFA